VELVVIDFGFSSKLTGSAAPVNTGHTLPFGTKYFLTESQCRSLTAQSGDFFQALQLVIYLAIMSSGGGSVSDALRNKETDFKGLGSRWLTQSKPWPIMVLGVILNSSYNDPTLIHVACLGAPQEPTC
jgi:hypothetical protein